MSYSEWNEYKFEELTINYNTKRIPLSSKKRLEKQGEFNYYGAQGIIDSIDEYIFEGEYLLIAEDGANLETRNQDIARLTKENEKFWVNNHAHIVKSNKKSDIRYLKYFLNYSDISGYVTGSAQPKLNKANLNSIKIILPALEEQRAISKILSDLDEKIEVNNKINKNLEEMAQAIFKQWFVDFEFPNEEGKPYKSSGGEMVESELGMIPKGFKISELKEIADDIITGKTPSTKNKENYGEKYPFITIPDMHNSIFINSSERYLSEKGSETQKSKLLPKNSIIVSCIATVGLVSITTKESHINQQINAVIIDKIEYLYYLYEAIKRKKELLLAIGSSGSATLNVNKKEFEKIKYLNPTNYYVNLFNSKVNILYEKIKANILENERLEKLRDTLLPKLMSGEIRVPLENSED
ncbi:restriction endonuclease subunit S [Clostridium perfringens]|uniref:restriction endonuclease subunit S n=1 Tax=Clostridium perfringens TaxID=1502 RepID=UPI00375434C7